MMRHSWNMWPQWERCSEKVLREENLYRCRHTKCGKCGLIKEEYHLRDAAPTPDGDHVTRRLFRFRYKNGVVVEGRDGRWPHVPGCLD